MEEESEKEHIYIYIYIYICVCVCVCVYIYMCVYIYIYTYIYIYIYTHTHIYVHIGLAKKFVWLVNTLFHKVSRENEKCVFYFHLKPNKLFGRPNTYISEPLCCIFETDTTL